MRVSGDFTNGRLVDLAVELGLEIVWMDGTGNPARSRGHFRLVPLGERWRVSGNDEACLHGYNVFIYRVMELGAKRIETAIRTYTSLDQVEDPFDEDFLLMRREVEARYGPQECSCRF